MGDSSTSRLVVGMPFLTALILVLLSNISPLSARTITTDDITIEQGDRKQTVHIRMDASTKTKRMHLNNPERFVLDLRPYAFPRGVWKKKVGGSCIKRVRMAQNPANMVRVVLDVQDNARCKSYYEVSRSTDNTVTAHLTLVEQDQQLTSPGQPPPATDNTLVQQESRSDALAQEQSPSSGNGEQRSFFADFDELTGIFGEETEKKEKKDLLFSGDIFLRGTAELSQDERVENNTSIRSRILGKAVWRDMVTLSFLSDLLYFGPEDEDYTWRARVHEAKWEYSFDRYAFSIGKQIIRWGKADQFSPVDSLNPEDMREFIVPDYEERKLPIWMADLRIFLGNLTVEGVFIPFFESNRMDDFSTDWAIFGHLKKQANRSSLPVALQQYINGLYLADDAPDNETELALRLSSTFAGVDFAASYHYANEDIPFISSFPLNDIILTGGIGSQQIPRNQYLHSIINSGDNKIVAAYKRSNIIGMEFETTVGDVGLRGEAVWQDKASFLTPRYISIRKPLFSTILGMDYTSPADSYINIQLVYTHVSDYLPDILFFERDMVSIIGELHTTFGDWLETGISFSQNLTNDDGYYKPYLKYSGITNVEVRCGVIFFIGDNEGWLGRFDDNDLVFLELRYLF